MLPIHQPPSSNESVRRWPSRVPRLRIATVLCVFVLTAYMLGGAGSTGVHAQAVELSLPDLQTTTAPAGGFDLAANWSSPEPHASLMRITGQEGFGDSWLEVQSVHTAEMNASLTFVDKVMGRRVTHERRLPAQRSVIFSLGNTPGLTFGSWSAQLMAPSPAGVIARTRWPSGAASGFKAVAPDLHLVLPLLIVEAHGHSTILTLMNGSRNADTTANLYVYENDTGGAQLAVNAFLEPLGTTSWDTAVESIHFGPMSLRRGPSGGYVGALWVRANQPVALLSYGDESTASGSTAITARAISQAEPRQHLPRVRSGPGGGTLIGVANTSQHPHNAVISYYASDGTLAALQEVALAPRGAAIIDLAGRRRGTLDLPSLPPGFHGSASIRATGAILAAAQDEVLVGQIVDTVAAYNGFGDADLGTAVGVPAVRRTTRFVTTAIVVHNPNDMMATATVELLDANGTLLASPTLTIPPHGVSTLDMREVAAFPAIEGSARVLSDQPVAVLSHDSRDDSIIYPLDSVKVGLGQERGSGIEGTAVLQETAEGFRVDIEMKPGTTGSFTTGIHEGTCSTDPGPLVHELEAVNAGRSGTVVRGGDLRAIGDGAHAIRLSRQGGRFGGLLSCGIVPWIRGVDFADAMLAEGIVISREAAAVPTLTPTQPEPSPTNAGAPAEPTPNDPTATPPPLDREGAIYLPRAIR